MNKIWYTIIRKYMQIHAYVIIHICIINRFLLTTGYQYNASDTINDRADILYISFPVPYIKSFLLLSIFQKDFKY